MRSQRTYTKQRQWTFSGRKVIAPMTVLLGASDDNDAQVRLAVKGKRGMWRGGG